MRVWIVPTIILVAIAVAGASADTRRTSGGEAEAAENISELDMLRAENAMLRRQVQRLTEELASLRRRQESARSTDESTPEQSQPGEPETATAAPSTEPPSTESPSAESPSAGLPTDAEIARLRSLLHRVGGGKIDGMEELTALRQDLARRLQAGWDAWTPQDVEVRCRIDKRIVAIAASEKGESWSPLIRFQGPVAAWVARATDREDLVMRLRVYERYVFDDNYVTDWSESYRRTLLSMAADNWMNRQGAAYRGSWERQQLRQWLASRVKSLAPQR